MTHLLIGFVLGACVVGVVAWFGLQRLNKRKLAALERAASAERMADVGAMTGGLAHEIKNPLSTIGLNAQLLGEAVEDASLPDDERSRMLSRATSLRREVDRLGGILSDFLEFAGQPHLELERAGVNDLVGELIDFYTPEAERRGVRLRADLATERLEARLDVRRVKQAVLNLMLNATQAMEAARGPASAGTGEGATASELILRTRADRPAGGLAAAGAMIRIEVNDTGPGIPPDKLASIFRPYFSTRSGGSGLGLPTARRLVEAHQGRMEVHSEVGRGTSFVVLLPVDPDAASDVESAGPDRTI